MRPRQHLLFAISFVFGLLTLIGLLGDVGSITSFILNFAGFLAAMALIAGVLNLLSVHIERLVSGRSVYSGILVFSMLSVLTLAITDSEVLSLTEGGVSTVFNVIQAPLEAAMASLVAFFLLFAGFRLLNRQRNWWSLLFLITAIVILAANALATSALLPEPVADILSAARDAIHDILVTAGVRGILIGVALGTIAISLRLIVGLDRPYNS